MALINQMSHCTEEQVVYSILASENDSVPDHPLPLTVQSSHLICAHVFTADVLFVH